MTAVILGVDDQAGGGERLREGAVPQGMLAHPVGELHGRRRRFFRIPPVGRDPRPVAAVVPER
jgi:hypothetical protein